MGKVGQRKSNRVFAKKLRKTRNQNENMPQFEDTSGPSSRFPTRVPSELERCWNSEKEVFLSGRGCLSKLSYHRDMNSCGGIDEIIGSRFGNKYRRQFLDYYRIMGDLASTKSLLKRLIEDGDVPRLRRFNLDKILHEDLPTDLQRKAPIDYSRFPNMISVEDMFRDEAQLIEAMRYLRNCIIQRIRFRDLCVRDCDRTLIDEKHQAYIIKLQILLAHTIYQYRRLTSVRISV